MLETKYGSIDLSKSSVNRYSNKKVLSKRSTADKSDFTLILVKISFKNWNLIKLYNNCEKKLVYKQKVDNSDRDKK